MIDTKYFANYYETILNNAGINYGKKFKIFADEGELKKAYQEYRKAKQHYVCGIVEITANQGVPIRDIKFDTYTCKLTLFVDLTVSGYDEEGQSIEMNEVREILTQLTDEIDGATSTVKIDNVSHSMTTTTDYYTLGDKTDLGFIAECLPIYWIGNFAFYESGLNSNDCKLKINGETVNFTRLTFTRKRTPESNTFNGDVSSKTIMQSQGLGIDFVMPATNKLDTFSNLVMYDILNGGNTALCIEIDTPTTYKEFRDEQTYALDGKKVFIGTFGDNVASLDIATNVGYNISVVEAKENLLNYMQHGGNVNSGWEIEEITENYKRYDLVAYKDCVIFWGDGTIEKVNRQQDNIDFTSTYVLSHTYKDNKPIHTMRVFLYSSYFE